MIAKMIARGHDRDEAIARLRRAVADTMVVVDGGTTNQGFLLELLGRPELRPGEVDTAWLDRLQVSGEAMPVRHADTALVQAAIALADRDLATDRARFYAFARRGRPQVSAELLRTYELRHRGHSYRLAVAQIAPARYLVEVDGARIEADVAASADHERRLELRRAGLPHADLAAGRRPARRGQRRPAPHLPRRRRPRAQPRARRGRGDPRSARATRWRPATSSRWSRR